MEAILQGQNITQPKMAKRKHKWRIKFQSATDRKFYKLDRDRMLEQQNGRCHYCREKLLPKDATFDHVIPLSEIPGRLHSLKNCVVACYDCNRKKGAKRDMPTSHLMNIVNTWWETAEKRLETRIRLAEYRLSTDRKGGFTKWNKYWARQGRWNIE